MKALSLLKGYAFVQYSNQTEAEMAIEILNGYSFFNQKLGNFLTCLNREAHWLGC
jgi:RNA recognition motif-containing protein